MRNLFHSKPRHWQDKMRAIEAKLCMPLLGEVFTCGQGCFRVADVTFEHNNLERDGNRSHLGVWLRSIGGSATDHMGRIGYSYRNQKHAIKMRDFLKHYEKA